MQNQRGKGVSQSIFMPADDLAMTEIQVSQIAESLLRTGDPLLLFHSLQYLSTTNAAHSQANIRAEGAPVCLMLLKEAAVFKAHQATSELFQSLEKLCILLCHS